MLVFGDQRREIDAREQIEQLAISLDRLAAMGPGLQRHTALVAAFLDAAELAQGALDAIHDGQSLDVWTRACARLLNLPLALARCVRASHESGYREPVEAPREPLESLRRMALPPTLSLRVPEGHALYALYPEAYLEAARTLPRDRPFRVVGIRSIGVGLACLVAAALDHARPPLTVRPVGHPFARRIELSRGATRRLLAGAGDARFAIVDEGPGCSGSSFGAVAGFLESRGIAPERIHFLPSHSGPPGARASEVNRRRWDRANRHPAPFESLFIERPDAPHALTAWTADLTGHGRLEDIGAGRWRAHRFRDEREWPPAFPQQERRKYLLRGERGDWLLKFAGLGRYGEEKVALARALGEAGFAPPVAGLRHGFVVQPWLADARSVDVEDGALRRELLLRLADYLAFRARVSSSRPGASPEALLTMAQHNAAEALGPERADSLRALIPLLPELARGGRPVRIDGRLMPWEWLLLPDGRLLKTDAIDHHAAHDLVGCQDVAWDVAGATVELALDADEQQRLARHVAAEARHPLPIAHLRFYELCYLAFRIGQTTLAAETVASDPAERSRLDCDRERYLRALERRLVRM